MHCCCTGAAPAAGLSRRMLLNRFGHGPRRPRARRSPEARALVAVARQPGSRRARRAAARPAQGQARHLPVHGRRAVADGDVRLQAGAQPAQRRAAARLGAPGPAADGHVRQPVVAAAGRLAVRLQPTRRQRRVGLRSAAAHRQGRRRPLHRPVDGHRGDQSRSGDHVLPDRIADRRPAEHRARGCTTVSAATTRICRRSSC